ncbi:FmdE family protein [Terriglobus roseus]|uniref:Formylmethanofuran dehydrogenase subunit E n=1 Tax=Terriglobus roseus TaxID=392734 RepID=A0A1H4L9U3_9BACT|nr:FmdE family protein [Terriglobus roseus]SEB67105.1 formylmethanofuran dehydrogenase subunit E [Terriglobus roseus]
MTTERISPLDLDALLQDAAVAHGHLCAGQVLGVRMAMHACHLLGVEEPRGKDRKRLVTFVEIDRCATDAIGVVTGCRLGKRALKFVDWGKMAATFIDLQRDAGEDVYGGVRIAARESSRDLARERFPEMTDKNQQQMRAYRELSDDDLFTVEQVEVTLPPNEFPGFKSGRVACAVCGEGINYEREVVVDGRVLCHGCAAPESRYYRVVS